MLRLLPKSAARLLGALLVAAMVPACGGSSRSATIQQPVYPVLAWGRNDFGQLGDETTADSTVAITATSSRSFRAIAAGEYHVLALDQNGRVTAWGSNLRGQLGGNISTETSSPVMVVTGSGTPLDNIIAIAAGSDHSVALRAGGTVYAWGANNHGQLGDGGIVAARNFAIPVAGLTDVVRIAAGTDHTLALRTDGTVMAWGNNSFAQLGRDHFGPGTTPQQVLAPGGVGFLSGVVELFAGRFHSFAVIQAGGLLGWGVNNTGQLGLNDTLVRKLPTVVAGLPPISSVSGGLNHTSAVDSLGQVWSWGDNGEGQLGSGSLSPSLVPIQVSNASGTGFLGDAISVSSGRHHSVACLRNGAVVSWGDNESGQLGDGSRIDRVRPVPTIDGGGGSVLGAAAVTAGSRFTVALGTPPRFSLRIPGNGNDDVPQRPFLSWDWVSTAATYRVEVSSAPDFSIVVLDLTGLMTPKLICPVALLPSTTYYWRARALTSAGQDAASITDIWTFTTAPAGRILGFGSDFNEQLGNGSAPPELWPVQVLASESPIAVFFGATKVAAGGEHSIALMPNGTVRAWGAPGKVGNGASGSNLPVIVEKFDGSTLSTVVDVTAGYQTSLALLSDGTLRTWGRDLQQPGGANQGGSNNDRAVAVVESGGTPLAAVQGVACGAFHAAALMMDGTVRTWGANVFGQLGDGTNTGSQFPITVLLSPGTPLTGVVQVVCGDDHVLALRNDGTVWGWGRQQGSSGVDTPTPIPVKGMRGLGTLTGVQQITTTTPSSEWHALALLQSGNAVAWGHNASGALGNGTAGSSSFIPVPVVDEGGAMLQGIQSLRAGHERSLAVMSDGGVRAWGSNPPIRQRLQVPIYAAAVAVDRYGVPLTGVKDASAAAHILLGQ